MKTSVLDFNLIDPVEAGEEWAVAFDSPYNVVEIYIDKVEIRDIVRPLEEAYMKESEPSLLRMGHEQYYSHLWPKLLYDNLYYARMRDPYFENDDCLLLGCVECGIPECWSFSIKVREDTIDLLAISVEAGLGYDAAILSIWKENKSPAMQELMRTIEDINYGMSRRDAYQSLAARCDVEEISLFSNNMVQADIMGISIVNVLKAQADALREARRRRAETQVQKAPIKMLLPLVLFVFPTMMLVLLGPAIINIFLYL